MSSCPSLPSCLRGFRKSNTCVGFKSPPPTVKRSVMKQGVTRVNIQSDRGLRRGRPTNNAARERSRVKTLRSAFLNLQLSLPAVPPDTKLSKLDVLLLATTYITHLRNSLSSGEGDTGNRGEREASARRQSEEGNKGTPDRGRHHPDTADRHPVKKWPMRTRLYDGILDSVRAASRVDDVRVSRRVDNRKNSDRVRERKILSRDRY